MQEHYTSADRPPKVLIIYTGGTIGMIENPETGVLEAFDFAYLEEHVPELKRFGFHIESLQFEQPVDSSAITPAFWGRLAEIIAEHYDTFDGFVILHGTDTMAYTASALSFMLAGLAKPVICTGSQLPIGRLRTDGKENLLTAIEIAASRGSDGRPRVPEVCIFFDNLLLRGNRSSKISADRFFAFESYNYPHLAAAGINIRYETAFIAPLPTDGSPFRIRTTMGAGVAVLKLFPGITPDLVKAVLNCPGVKAVVMETFGSGNAPMQPWFLQAIGDAVGRGVVIVNVTQCKSGCVDMYRYETGQELARIGLVSGYDITTECAIVKLMYLLGLNDDPAAVKDGMHRAFCGEVTISPEEHKCPLCG